MARLNTQIQESTESKEARISEKFKDGILKSLDFPVLDAEGYCVGQFTGFELVEPTGEVRTSRKGSIWTDKRAQIKFTFKVSTESGDYLNLNFWTGTCIDGVKDEKGRYSKLTTWFVAIGALDESSLHPKFKVDETSLMAVIKEVFEKEFRFKTEMDGRIHKPVIESFQLIEDETEETTELDTE